MTFPTTSFLPPAPPESFYCPQPLAMPIPSSPQRPLPPEFPPTPSAPLSSHDSFNASTLPACSSSTCGKTPLSGITPKENSTPTSGRRGIQTGAVNTSCSVRTRSILLPLHFPKLHSGLRNCRSLKAPARPSPSGTSLTIQKRIARHYRGSAQSGATLQGPLALKRYRIFLPSKVQKPQSNQAPLTHTNT